MHPQLKHNAKTLQKNQKSSFAKEDFWRGLAVLLGTTMPLPFAIKTLLEDWHGLPMPLDCFPCHPSSACLYHSSIPNFCSCHPSTQPMPPYVRDLNLPSSLTFCFTMEYIAILELQDQGKRLTKHIPQVRQVM